MPVRLKRHIPTTRSVATKLARHRRRRTTQPTRDLPDAQPLTTQVSDPKPLILRQEPVADLTHGRPVQWRAHPDHRA